MVSYRDTQLHFCLTNKYCQYKVIKKQERCWDNIEIARNSENVIHSSVLSTLLLGELGQKYIKNISYQKEVHVLVAYKRTGR